MFEFRPSDWPVKYFSGQSARRSSPATVTPSYTKWFFSSMVGCYLAREGSHGEFQRKKKDSTKPRKSQAVTWTQAREQYSSFNFHCELIEGKTTIEATDTLEHQPGSGQYLTHAHSQSDFFPKIGAETRLETCLKNYHD